MRLQNEAGLALDLERGLEEIYRHLPMQPPSLHLREPVCGTTSIALAEALNKEGVKASTVISKPRLPADQDMTHVIIRASSEGETAYIDPTYSQFVALAGLTTRYVRDGRIDYFPQRKIAVFREDEGYELARELGETIDTFRTHKNPHQRSVGVVRRMEELDRDTIVEQLSEIWKSEHFEPFQPSKATLEAGRQLAAFILPEHVRLVA